jgi:hypothetical protein
MGGKLERISNDLAKIIDDEWKRNNREITKILISKRIAETYKKYHKPVARISNYPFRSKLRIIKE